ncbi:PREDICTED: uncharacterized protein LOC108973165, partial [Bactrocera latifrons]|uniref:uncharacterized protein LOC108973165 n=1 Tax=Bactrocera latifrons TaxID=174628 RepID=UPI0008DCD88B
MFKLISGNYVLTIILLLLFSKSSNIAFAICNACSISNFYCASQTQFQVCVNGLPTGTALSYPDGYICSITVANICVPSASQPFPALVLHPLDSPTTTTTSGSVIVTNRVSFYQTIQQMVVFQYVYCFINGNVWSGAIYDCPSATYFD